MPTAVIILVVWLSVDAVVIAWLVGRTNATVKPHDGKPWGITAHDSKPWFDSDQFRAPLIPAGRTGVLVHPCSDGRGLIEYPVHPGFDEDHVLATLADIETL